MDGNYLDLLRCLNGAKVKYLIIGGYAVIYHSEPRYTKDLDIWIEASAQNARRTIQALREFDAPIDNLTVEDLETPGLIYVFGLPPLRVDILNKATGCSFASAWKARAKVKIDGVLANFIDKAGLIKLKKAAGRPQDLADLEKLKVRK